MDIQVAILCDAATDYAGKLCILGAFDTIQSLQLPVVHQCTIALRMTFNKNEEGQHKIRLSIVDEDGQPIMPVIEPPAPLEVVVPDDSIFVSRNLIVIIQRMTFSKVGLYSVEISVDDCRKGSIPLLVKVLAQRKQYKPQND